MPTPPTEKLKSKARAIEADLDMPADWTPGDTAYFFPPAYFGTPNERGPGPVLASNMRWTDYSGSFGMPRADKAMFKPIPIKAHPESCDLSTIKLIEKRMHESLQSLGREHAKSLFGRYSDQILSKLRP